MSLKTKMTAADFAKLADNITRKVVNKETLFPYQGEQNDPYEKLNGLLYSHGGNAYVDRDSDKWKIYSERAFNRRPLPLYVKPELGTRNVPAEMVLWEAFGMEKLEYVLTDRERDFFGQLFDNATVYASHGGFRRHEKLSEWEVVSLTVNSTASNTVSMFAVFHPEDGDMLKLFFGRYEQAWRASSKDFVDLLITAGTIMGDLDIG